jgi:hypothetical protein
MPRNPRARSLDHFDIRGTHSGHTCSDGRFLFVTGYVGVIADPVEDLVGTLHVIDDLILRVYDCCRSVAEKLCGSVEPFLHKLQVRDSFIE